MLRNSDFAHTVYLRGSPKSFNRLAFIVDMLCVFCEVGTESLHNIYMIFRPRNIDEIFHLFDRLNLAVSKNALSRSSLHAKVMN
jgi:hypothetical protein